jgi:transcriptional regulator with XRE-family HTH domain
VARGVTQEELAKILGVDRVTVARYELGMRTLTVPTLFTILEYLEIPMPGLQVEELGQNRKAVTGAASPAVQRIVQTLEKRPDLLPSVEELLDTMLED